MDPNSADHVVYVLDSFGSLGRSPDPNKPVGFQQFWVNGTMLYEDTVPYGIATASPDYS